MPLTDEDVDRIAVRTTELMQERVRQFYIEPEEHYQDHLTWRQWRTNLNTASKIFWTAFVGLVAVGLCVLAFIGLAHNGGK